MMAQIVAKLLQSVYNIIFFVNGYDGEQYPECLKQYIYIIVQYILYDMITE